MPLCGWDLERVGGMSWCGRLCGVKCFGAEDVDVGEESRELCALKGFFP